VAAPGRPLAEARLSRHAAPGLRPGRSPQGSCHVRRPGQPHSSRHIGAPSAPMPGSASPPSAANSHRLKSRHSSAARRARPGAQRRPTRPDRLGDASRRSSAWTLTGVSCGGWQGRAAGHRRASRADVNGAVGLSRPAPYVATQAEPHQRVAAAGAPARRVAAAAALLRGRQLLGQAQDLPRRRLPRGARGGHQRRVFGTPAGARRQQLLRQAQDLPRCGLPRGARRKRQSRVLEILHKPGAGRYTCSLRCCLGVARGPTGRGLCYARPGQAQARPRGLLTADAPSIAAQAPLTLAAGAASGHWHSQQGWDTGHIAPSAQRASAGPDGAAPAGWVP